MSLAACLLSSSEKLTIDSSIANIYARDSFTAQGAMVSLRRSTGAGSFSVSASVTFRRLKVCAVIAMRNRWRR